MEIIDEGKANRHVAVTSKFNREVVFLKKKKNNMMTSTLVLWIKDFVLAL